MPISKETLVPRYLERLGLDPDQAPILEEFLAEASADYRLDDCELWLSPAGYRLRGFTSGFLHTIPVSGPEQAKVGMVVEVPGNPRQPQTYHYFIGSYAKES